LNEKSQFGGSGGRVLPPRCPYCPSVKKYKRLKNRGENDFFRLGKS
jgi:hypothetical protein